MKRVFLLLAFVIGMASVANAQTEVYKSLLMRQFAVLGSSINVDMLKQQIGPIYAKQAGVSVSSVQDKVNDYFANRFLDDMVEMIVPYYEQAISVADYEKYIREIERPEVGEAMRNTNAAVKDDTYLSRYVLQMMEPGFKEVESKMPADFKVVFDKYFEVTECQTLVDNWIVAIKNALGDDESDICGKLKNNLHVIMGNEVYTKNVTADDLQLLVDVYSMPESKGVNAASKKMTEDAMGLGMKLINRVLESLK